MYIPDYVNKDDLYMLHGSCMYVLLHVLIGVSLSKSHIVVVYMTLSSLTVLMLSVHVLFVRLSSISVLLCKRPKIESKTVLFSFSFFSYFYICPFVQETRDQVQDSAFFFFTCIMIWSDLFSFLYS